MKYPTNLADRIRPDCEAAPWVCAEVRLMEQQRDELVGALTEANLALKRVQPQVRGVLPVEDVAAAIARADAALAKARP